MPSYCFEPRFLHSSTNLALFTSCLHQRTWAQFCTAILTLPSSLRRTWASTKPAKKSQNPTIIIIRNRHYSLKSISIIFTCEHKWFSHKFSYTHSTERSPSTTQVVMRIEYSREWAELSFEDKSWPSIKSRRWAKRPINSSSTVRWGGIFEFLDFEKKVFGFFFRFRKRVLKERKRDFRFL